jgi:hypothetical protein
VPQALLDAGFTFHDRNIDQVIEAGLAAGR